MVIISYAPQGDLPPAQSARNGLPERDGNVICFAHLNLASPGEQEG